jgi:hypothetical protein
MLAAARTLRPVASNPIRLMSPAVAAALAA